MSGGRFTAAGRLDAGRHRAVPSGEGSRFFASSLAFSPGAFLGHRVIREHLVIDNSLDHLADIRSQQPVDCDPDKLRRIQDRASLHDRVNPLFLIRP